MRFNYKTLIGIGLSFLLTSTINAEIIVPDVAAGKEKAATVCIACHGPAGVSINPEWPKLAGQHKGYIKAQIRELRRSYSDQENGLRIDPFMGPQANLLTDQDIENVAAYFSSLDFTYGPILDDPELIQRGREIYRGGDIARKIPACSACHSPTGLGNGPANYPHVSGQHATYIENQLVKFKKGTRSNDPARMMRDIAERLSDDEIKAVSAYIQALRP